MAATGRPPLSAREPRRAASLTTSELIDNELLALEDGEPDEPPAPAPAQRRGGGRGPQSASPRVQRFRPVDAVRMAKRELITQGGSSLGKAPKLRLAALPAPDASLEGMHEGFYDFAKAVVKPQPSARQYAQHLHEELKASLQTLRIEVDPAAAGTPRADGTKEGQRPGGTGRGGADDATGTFMTDALAIADDELVAEPFLAEADRARSQVRICMETLEQFVSDTTTESRERGALLGTAKSAAAAAVERLVAIVRERTRSAQKAEKAMADLEASLHKVEEDNAGLRHVVQQMLSTESDLRDQGAEARRKATVLEKQLQEAQHRIAEINEDLKQVSVELQDMKDEAERGRAVQDACSSPMMGFSMFTLGPDQVPPVANVELLAVSPTQFLAGFDVGDKASPADHSDRRKTMTTQDSDGFQQSAHGRATRHSIFSESGRGGVAANAKKLRNLSAHHAAIGDPTSRTSVGRALAQREGVAHPLPYSASRSSIAVAQVSAANSPSDSRPGSRPTSRPASRGSPGGGSEKAKVYTPEASPLATSFPALIPFLDYSALDAEPEKPRPESERQNQEHIEKHLVMLQEEYQQATHRSETLQRCVDVALEKVLVWVQAIHDSLQDLSSTAVLQDVRALGIVRDAVEWLAKHPCKDWNNAGHLPLDALLDHHETKVRIHLASVRPVDNELNTLRKELAQSRQQAEDLAGQLSEAKAAALGVGSRSPTKARANSASASSGVPGVRRGSAASAFGGAGESPRAGGGVQHIGVQCELLQNEIQEAPSRTASIAPRSEGAASAARMSSYSPRALPRNTVSPVESPGPAMSQPSDEVPVDPDEELGEPSTGSDLGAKGAAASVETEAQRARLLRCPFVAGIDLTLVPLSDRVLLRPPLEGADGNDVAQAPPGAPSDDKRLPLKQLRAVIAQVYSEKRADDARRDKAHQARRELHVVLQEQMRRHHGVKKVVHRKCWQLVESVAYHAEADRLAATFADFLDGTRDLDELSFYLYCSRVFTASVAEESQALPPGRATAGWVGAERASRAAEMLFGDLPKALGVIRVELEKCTRVFAHEPLPGAFEAYYSTDLFGTLPDAAEPRVPIEELYRILLEGWRLSALLLEESVPGFSWRRSVLAFLQADVQGRGWLDPHEVRACEEHRLGRTPHPAEGLRLLDQTTMGSFVFREVHRCGVPNAEGTLARSRGLGGANAGATSKSSRVRGAEAAAGLKVSQAVFGSLEKTLGIFLTWLMHSEELGDLAVYHSVKSHMYGFRQASDSAEGIKGTHHLRCLLLLLLAHQFDSQLQHGGVAADFLQWELGCLVRVLTEGWRRTAALGNEAGPDFGGELEVLAGASAG